MSSEVSPSGMLEMEWGGGVNPSPSMCGARRFLLYSLLIPGHQSTMILSATPRASLDACAVSFPGQGSFCRRGLAFSQNERTAEEERMCHPVGGEEMTGRPVQSSQPHPADGITERGPSSPVHNSTQVTTAEPGSEPRPLTSLLLHFPDSVPMWEMGRVLFLPPSTLARFLRVFVSLQQLIPATSFLNNPQDPWLPTSPTTPPVSSLPFSSAPGLLSGLSVLETGLQLASWLPFALENYLKCLVLAVW